MNELKIFESKEFGKVRTVEVNGEPYFVGKDIATILGYRNPSKAIIDRVDDDDKLSSQFSNSGQAREMTVINESGLYSLILSSKLPTAKQFKRWVTSEILPTIRKTGGYVSNTDMFVNTYLPFADDNTKNLFRLQLETITQLNNKIEEQRPKIEYYKNVLNKDGLITTTMIAKDLGLTSAKKLNEILNANRVIYKQSNSWHPYADYDWLITEGYADYQSYDVDKSNPILKWTEKGRQWIVGNYETWLENAEFED